MRVFTLVHLVIILGFHRCQCGLPSGGGASSPDGASKGPKGATLRTPVAKQEANNNEDKAESTANKALKQQSRGLETTTPNPGSLETSSERFKPSPTISTGGTSSTHSVEGSSSGQSDHFSAVEESGRYVQGSKPTLRDSQGSTGTHIGRPGLTTHNVSGFGLTVTGHGSTIGGTTPIQPGLARETTTTHLIQGHRLPTTGIPSLQRLVAPSCGLANLATPENKVERGDGRSDDGRCEGGTHFNGPPQRDKEQPTQHVRKDMEREPKRHVKTSQASQEETIPSPIPTIKDAILDITDVDLKIFTMSESFMDGMLVKKTFTPNDGFRLMEVLDMNLPIWASSGQDGYAKSVVVHYSKNGSHLLSITINNDHSTKPKYFENVGSSWNEIKDTEFNEKLKKDPIVLLTPEVQDVTSSSPTDSRETTLDIASPDSSSIDTHTRMPYEMVQTIYTARDGYRIASVIESGREIWKAKDGYSCTHVNVLTHGNEKTHMNIYVRDKEGAKMPLYYAKDDEEWNTIEEDAFYSSFHLEAVKGSTIETIALDIKARSDPAKFYINGSLDFPFSVYAPNVGYRIEKVGYTSNIPTTDPAHAGKRIGTVSTIIWSAQSEDEGCLYVSLYPMYDHKLAYMIIHTSGGLKELYYSKSSGSWKSVERDAYMKKLAEAGFNESTFTNEITADLSRPNRIAFRIKEQSIDNYAVHLYTAHVGFRMRAIVDDGEEVWKASGDEHSTYINLILQDKKPFAFFILIDDPKGDRKVLYFIKSDGEWKNVTKSDYHALMPVRVNGMTLDKIYNPRITMSSFRNRQGLKIITYASTVDNAKADIVLCHGVRSHFMSDFGASSSEWNYEHYGSPAFLDIKGVFLRADSHNNPTDMHRHLFEHGFLDGKDASSILPAYEYEGSIIEFFNKLGYNVYGMDMQSHGLSEAQTEKKCYVKDFKDYLHDLLQFISIVKRGKFSDTTEKWNDATVFRNTSTGRKTILMGNSMGGNIVIQAVQEFYRHADSQAKLVDGLIVTSGMFNIDFYLDTMAKKAAKSLLTLFTENALAKTNTYETPLDYGGLFDLFVRHREPFFKTSRLTFKAAKLAFDACDDVKKDDNMVYYPKNLPTLLFHSKDDLLCDVKGSREMVNKLNKEKVMDIKFIELDSSFHYLASPQAMIVLQPHLKEWLDKHTSI